MKGGEGGVSGCVNGGVGDVRLFSLDGDEGGFDGLVGGVFGFDVCVEGDDFLGGVSVCVGGGGRGGREGTLCSESMSSAIERSLRYLTLFHVKLLR